VNETERNRTANSQPSPPPHSSWQRPLRWSLTTAAVAGLAACALTTLLFWGSTSGWWWLIPAATSATVLITFCATWLMLRGAQPPTPLKGVLVGFIAGLLCHPATWYLVFLTAYLAGVTSSLGEPTIDPLGAILAAALYSLISLPTVGVITIPLSMALGALVAWLYRKTTAPAPPAGRDVGVGMP
jgi:hypothetical protein